MTGLIVVGAIVLALVLLMQVRVGAQVCFDEDGLTAWARAGFLRIRVFPPKKPAKRGEHPAGKKKKPPKDKGDEAPAPTGPGGKWEQFKLYADIGIKAAARLRRKLRIDLLRMDVLWAADDPAAAALGYGYLSAALSTLLPALESAFHVRRREIRTGVDFQGTSPTVWAQAAISLTIGQGLAMGLAALVALLRGRRRLKKQSDNRLPQSRTNKKKEANAS